MKAKPFFTPFKGLQNTASRQFFFFLKRIKIKVCTFHTYTHTIKRRANIFFLSQLFFRVFPGHSRFFHSRKTFSSCRAPSFPHTHTPVTSCCSPPSPHYVCWTTFPTFFKHAGKALPPTLPLPVACAISFRFLRAAKIRFAKINLTFTHTHTCADS